jgi:hypothetical protein
LDERRVAKEPPSHEELRQLRFVAERSLADAQVEGLSNDGRFGLAYDAARSLATLVVRAAGYRVKGHGGAHYNTFLALEAAGPRTFKRYAVYFNACREKRNDLSYESAEVVSEREVAELLRTVPEFAGVVDLWVRERRDIST